MKQFKSIFLFLLMLFSAPIFATEQKTAALELTQLLNGFSTFQAQFTQTTTDTSHQILQKSSGTMMLMRPGRFRWETKDPTHQVVITDGKIVWVYDIDLKQATKQFVQNSPINPAKLLAGNVATLTKQFDVHMIPHQKTLVFQLIPKKPMQQFRSVTIAFQNHQLHSMQIQNALEQTNTFEFSNVVVNKSLSPDLFTFTPPRGVDVMQ